MELCNTNTEITNADVKSLLDTTKDSANALLSVMVRKGMLDRVKRGKYRKPSGLENE